MNQADNGQKITPGHLARKAVVYLRQSSLAQVKHNQESQESNCQYDDPFEELDAQEVYVRHDLGQGFDVVDVTVL